MLPPLPRCSGWRNPRSSHPAVAAFPDTAVGSACTSTFSRLAWRSLALRPAHSRGHQLVTAIRRLQPFRYLHDCSDCFRRERIAGWDLHPLEKRRLFTAHTVSGHCPKARSRRHLRTHDRAGGFRPPHRPGALRLRCRVLGASCQRYPEPPSSDDRLIFDLFRGAGMLHFGYGDTAR